MGQGQRRGHAVEHLVQPREHVLVISKQGLSGKKNIFISLHGQLLLHQTFAAQLLFFFISDNCPNEGYRVYVSALKYDI